MGVLVGFRYRVTTVESLSGLECYLMSRGMNDVPSLKPVAAVKQTVDVMIEMDGLGALLARLVLVGIMVDISLQGGNTSIPGLSSQYWREHKYSGQNCVVNVELHENRIQR